MLGGDSLRAVKAASRLAVCFGVEPGVEEVLLEALLDGASSRQVAELLTNAHPATSSSVGRETGPWTSASELRSDARLGVQVTADAIPREVLSYSEERIWLAGRFFPGSPVYHVVNAFQITGRLDVTALDRAVVALVARHPALRTGYDEDAPVAYVFSPSPARLDLAHHAAASKADALAQATLAAREPLDLAGGRPLRVRTYHCAEDDSLLLVVVHHIATDGWSMRLLYRELEALYSGRSPDTSGAGRSYREFARWQQGAATARIRDRARCWAQRLTPLPNRVELSPRRRPNRSAAGDVIERFLPAPVTTKLGAVADQARSSLFVVLLAILHLCLARRTRQWDTLLGTVVAGRSRPEDHATVGFFANTLPLRVSARPDETALDLVARLREEWRHLLSHQDVPLEELAALTDQPPGRAHAPLTNVVLVLQDSADGSLELPGCSIRRLPVSNGTAKFDLLVEVLPARTGELTLRWEYATDVLTSAVAADLADSFSYLAGLVAADPNLSVRQASRLSPAEARRVVSAGRAPRRPRDADTDVGRLFAAAAARSPEAVAVLDGSAVLRFGELSLLRDRVVSGLHSAGVKAGDVVALELPRSALSIAAMLAVWSSGAVLMMTDAGQPAAYRAEMLRLSRPAAALAATRTESAASALRIPVLTPPDIASAWAEPTAVVPADPADPAWLVATSGSEGAPKLTAGSHRGLVNRCLWGLSAWPYQDGEIAALRTPLSFVDAIAETLVPLLAGIPVVVVPASAALDITALIELVARHRVTRLLVTPLLMHALLDVARDLSPLSSLQVCTFSGEALDARLVSRARRGLPGCRLVNLYGSAELAGDVTAAEVTDCSEDQDVPLGRPIRNTTIQVVDEAGEPVPPGAIGELVVHGDAVGLGYLRDEGPGAAGLGLVSRLARTGGYECPAMPGTGPGFRTGDLGWLDSDGEFRFAGRRDHQVKIRGCRVELGQVETALRALDDVVDAVAWAEPGAHGARLMAVVSSNSPGRAGTLSEAERDRVRTVLPAYMVPSQVFIEPGLALTVNGKLDRARAVAAAREHPSSPAVPMASALERRIQEIWADLIGERVGPHQDFFAAGGDSLAANRMLATISAETGVRLGLNTFLACPTIRGIAIGVTESTEGPAGHVQAPDQA